MNKLLDLLDLFRKGAAVSEPALWKNRSALVMALTALILTGCRVARGYGYEIPISDTDAASIAAGIAVLVGLFSTYATSDKVGLLSAKPVPPEPVAPLEHDSARVDGGRPAQPGEPYNAERGY